jgi:drug/metabolite transporter (DMT)-like permease
MHNLTQPAALWDVSVWRTCAIALSLTIAVVVCLYWSKGVCVVAKVIIYLLALSSMKGAVKLVEGMNFFNYPLFLTGAHFASGAVVAFMILLYTNSVGGEKLAIPPLKAFGNRFAPIAMSFALSVSMNNMALVHSTTAFCEIVCASSPIITVLVTLAMKKPFEKKLLGPCFLVFLGCMLTSNAEPHFSMLGFVLAAGSNVPRAMKTVLQQLVLQNESETTYTPVEVLAWTCLPSSVVMLSWSMVQEGAAPYHQLYQQGLRSHLIGAVLLSCVNACILNTAVLFVVKDLGAVGAQIVAQLKSLLVVLGGMVFLREQVSLVEFVGFIVVMAGVYSYNDLELRHKAKLADKNEKAKATVGADSAQ